VDAPREPFASFDAALGVWHENCNALRKATLESMMSLHRNASITALLVACLMAASCASQRSVPKPEELTRAAATVGAAEKAGAYEHGNTEMTMARRKLKDAERALEDGDKGVAARLAEEADLDAQLAMAKARSQEMQAAVAELNENIRTLQQELRRSDLETLGRL
jgi:peptidoglycan hydrolase CwlO-like protein